MTTKPTVPSQTESQSHLFTLHELIPTLTSAVLTGLITIAYAISFAALAFGEQPGITSRGIGLALGGAVVIRLIIAVAGSRAGIMASPQDVPAAILGLITGGIIGSFPAEASTQEIFITVITAVIITDLIIGLFLLMLGYFQLGELIRFLPYPVIGGFLAGTGWLLMTGGLGVMTSLSMNLGKLPMLAQTHYLPYWLPGLAFAIILFVVLKHFNHFAILPSLLLGTIALFYLVVWVSGASVTQVMDQGWLMGPFPQTNMWEPVNFADFSQVRWSLIWAQSGNIATVLLISVVALLLNATGLELIYQESLDLNKELRTAGWGNLAMALLGGIPGFHGVSLSALHHKIGSKGRIAGVLSAVVILFALLFGTTLLALVPRLLIGGIVTYLGLGLLYQWLYEAWFNFSTIEYLIILTILLVIATIGFLEGVVLGTILALILFVVNYSRINVIKHALSGANYQSRVTRNQQQRNLLNEEGAALYILELQGFIFFGTANTLLKEVSERLMTKGLPRLRFVLLDFRQVTGLDSTALLGFAKIKQLAKKQDVLLIFTDLAPAIKHKLVSAKEKDNSDVIRLFSDLDHGLEWCENEILQTAGISLYGDHENLLAQLQAILPQAPNLTDLLGYFERLEVDQGYYLMKQGDRPDDLFFVERGQVTAQLEYPDREPLRLETMRGGRVVGEIGFYLSSDRTAAVVTDEPSVIYRFSLGTLTEIEKSDPAAASTFHQIIVHLLSHRLTHLITTVKALQR